MKEREELQNAKRLLREGEKLKAGDEMFRSGEFVDVKRLGIAGRPVNEGDFVLRPPENEGS